MQTKWREHTSRWFQKALMHRVTSAVYIFHKRWFQELHWCAVYINTSRLVGMGLSILSLKTHRPKSMATTSKPLLKLEIPSWILDLQARCHGSNAAKFAGLLQLIWLETTRLNASQLWLYGMQVDAPSLQFRISDFFFKNRWSFPCILLMRGNDPENSIGQGKVICTSVI